MSDFNFDARKRFTDNCADFLESVKDIDPEMAEILEANWAKLLVVVREGKAAKKIGGFPRIRGAFVGFLT